MIEKLACKLGRNDEMPNIELAEQLCETEDTEAIKEIVVGFKGSDRAVANDCIKVLYEIGARKPQLIAGYAPDFIARLQSKNNRLAWGSMTALASVAELAADTIYENLPAIQAAYQNGSVITVDNSISMFAKMCKENRKYMDLGFPILIRHLKTCRPKEVAQHAERVALCVIADNAKEFAEVLEQRIPDLSPASASRVMAILRKQVFI